MKEDERIDDLYRRMKPALFRWFETQDVTPHEMVYMMACMCGEYIGIRKNNEKSAGKDLKILTEVMRAAMKQTLELKKDLQ